MHLYANFVFMSANIYIIIRSNNCDYLHNLILLAQISTILHYNRIRYEQQSKNRQLWLYLRGWLFCPSIYSFNQIIRRWFFVYFLIMMKRNNAKEIKWETSRTSGVIRDIFKTIQDKRIDKKWFKTIQDKRIDKKWF